MSPPLLPGGVGWFLLVCSFLTDYLGYIRHWVVLQGEGIANIGLLEAKLFIKSIHTYVCFNLLLLDAILMDVEYTWILWQGKIVVNLGCYNIIYYSVCSSSIHPIGGDGGIIISASYKFHFIRVHDNLVSDPSNNKSIAILIGLNFLLIKKFYYSK